MVCNRAIEKEKQEKMNVQNVIRKRKEVKNVSINIRISKDLSNWLREKNYSPTAIFMEAVKDLGYRKPRIEVKNDSDKGQDIGKI